MPSVKRKPTKGQMVVLTRTIMFYYTDDKLSNEDAIKDSIREAEYWSYNQLDYSAQNCEYDSGWKEVSDGPSDGQEDRGSAD